MDTRLLPFPPPLSTRLEGTRSIPMDTRLLPFPPPLSTRLEGTRSIPVCKVLGGNISYWQLGEDHLGATLDKLVQLLIQYCPFCIHNLLVLLRVQTDKQTDKQTDRQTHITLTCKPQMISTGCLVASFPGSPREARCLVY